MESNKTTPLDEMLQDEPLQILKASIPYCNPSMQQFLSIYAKVFELQKTVSMFQNAQKAVSICSADMEPKQPLDLLSSISPYCGKATQEKINTIVSMMATLSAMQMFQEEDDS